ncbi:MAG: hypothetical protein JRI23_10695 [Deltaproteobacteria bacterium]|jgi:hypothetical protein|nr:hypothetical protein [Deltaproteobacteria bacterium]MBW2532145.1 hypothetical protein [Deltaproteobacteria bacterium]
MGNRPSAGLTAVPTDDLKSLLRYIHRGEVTCPVTPGELARIGLQDRSEPILHVLRGLDEAAARAVLVAVLAERDG